MNLRDLKYLVALVEHRHFGKAAEACFVSQPALSMQIKKLEEYLNVQLIERNNKTVMLTPSGTILAERARSIVNQVQELKQAASTLSDPFSGEIKIGIIPTLAPYLLPHIMAPLSRHFPKIQFYLIEEKTTELLKRLKEGKLDCAILALPINESGLEQVSLFQEEFFLGVSKQHPLSKRKIIKQSELSNQEILLLEDGHCLRDQALDICNARNAKESERFRATSLETLRHMIACGMGATFIPRLAARENDQIIYLSFNHPKPMRLIGMTWRASSPRKELFQAMDSIIKKAVPD